MVEAPEALGHLPKIGSKPRLLLVRSSHINVVLYLMLQSYIHMLGETALNERTVLTAILFDRFFCLQVRLTNTDCVLP